METIRLVRQERITERILEQIGDVRKNFVEVVKDGRLTPPLTTKLKRRFSKYQARIEFRSLFVRRCWHVEVEIVVPRENILTRCVKRQSVSLSLWIRMLINVSFLAECSCQAVVRVRISLASCSGQTLVVHP